MESSQNQPDPRCELFVEENGRAEYFIQTNDLRSAAQILVPVLEKDPANWRALNDIGIISWMRKAWDDAYRSFFQAVLIKPDYEDSLVNLFDAAIKLRKIPEIAPLFEKAFRTNPSLQDIKTIWESIRDQGDDIYLSERAMRIGTYNPLIEEADRLLTEGKLYEAMDKYIQVNDNEGANADAFCGLGIISYQHRRFDDAFTLFLESVKLNPTNADTFLNLLDAARACSKIEIAQKIFEVYRKEFPSLAVIDGQFKSA